MCSSFGSLCLPWEDLLAEWYTVYCVMQGIVANATLAGNGAGEYWHVMLQQGHHAIITDQPGKEVQGAETPPADSR